jgi:hypothetical protein
MRGRQAFLAPYVCALLMFAPVRGTGLQSVRNTNSVLFFEPSSGRFFLLISGRWFAWRGFDGPWTFASNDLLPDFALIPPEDLQAKVRRWPVQALIRAHESAGGVNHAIGKVSERGQCERKPLQDGR